MAGLPPASRLPCRSHVIRRNTLRYCALRGLIGRWEQGKGKPQFDYIIKLANVLEVSLDQLLLGAGKQQSAQFDIQNRKLKELCIQVDQLKPEDQDVICHFLDMAVRQDRLRHIVTDSISTVR